MHDVIVPRTVTPVAVNGKEDDHLDHLAGSKNRFQIVLIYKWIVKVSVLQSFEYDNCHNEYTCRWSEKHKTSIFLQQTRENIKTYTCNTRRKE